MQRVEEAYETKKPAEDVEPWGNARPSSARANRPVAVDLHAHWVPPPYAKAMADLPDLQPVRARQPGRDRQQLPNQSPLRFIRSAADCAEPAAGRDRCPPDFLNLGVGDRGSDP